ncbi:hypothetical protein [Flavobacterium stagni]|uniref:Uncharacterized protein n=1 Tax=Flavobacterium stagni TaxID=2506421 RepID=A0A4Q1KA93_9FLAO|nr:hypothetical protein [Flavobacterium stagni]RXR21588.1 hypothetical protein EQG61_11290 [Flavobacterium stagni]
MRKWCLLLFFHAALLVTGQNTLDLSKPLVLGHFDENQHFIWEVNKTDLREQINTLVGPSSSPFTQIALAEEKNTRSQESLLFLELKSEKGQRIFYKWLVQKGNQIMLGSSDDFTYQALTNFIICEGVSNCAPELLYDGTSYELSCQKSNYFSNETNCKRTVGRFVP